jgi:AraC family transcriptional activator of pobA
MDNHQDDILVDRLGDYLDKHPDLTFPHKHNFFHLVVFTEGSGSHSIDFTAYPVKPWQIYFMSPGQVHTWEFSGKMDGYVINFNKEFFQSFLLKPDYMDSFFFFNGSINIGAQELPKAIRDEVISLCQKLYDQVNFQVDVNPDFKKILLLSFFMLLEHHLDNAQKYQLTNHNFTLLHNFQKLIEEKYATIRLPKDYASLLFVTPTHLNTICKEFLGMQAGEVIRERVLLEAKRLLASNNFSVSEIADELNFNDNSYFTKFFKKHVGITPEEFKKQLVRH